MCGRGKTKPGALWGPRFGCYVWIPGGRPLGPPLLRVLGLLLLGHHALAGVYDCAGCYHDHCEDDQDDRPGRESSAFLFNRYRHHCRHWRRRGRHCRRH